MARALTTQDLITGILLTILGLLVLLGNLRIPFLAQAVAVVAILFGVVYLVSRKNRHVPLGVTLSIIGLLLLFTDLLDPLADIALTLFYSILGAVLLVAGVLKLLGVW